MIVNVGGFGHTGNTALKDFLVDSGAFLPLAENYGETSILRSVWGVGTLLKIAKNLQAPINPQYIFDLLLGYENGSEKTKGAPTIHDFKRNARVRLRWGRVYISLVERLVENYKNFLTGKIDNINFLKEVSLFFSSLKDISLSENKHLLMRNDPPAYNPELMQLGLIDKSIFIYRDPLDTCYEWIDFYHDSYNIDNVNIFIKQFNKKVENFFKKINNMKDEDVKNIFLIDFESLVRSKNKRDQLIDFIGIESNNKEKKNFIYDDSNKNIGVGWKNFDHDFINIIKEKTNVNYIRLKDFSVL